MTRRFSLPVALVAIFAAGLAAAFLSSGSDAFPLHQSGCHGAHSCPSDHHTYVWMDPGTGQTWDCVEPGAREYDPSRDTMTIVFQGLTYYCRSGAGSPPPTTAPPTTTTTTTPVGLQCGIERWSVKTLSDTAAASVNFNPVATTVDALRALPAPSVTASTPRIAGVETSTYSVQARLVEMTLEDDHDIHLVIADPNSGGTMIAEFPDPQCSGAVTSVRAVEMAAARAALMSAVGAPTTTFRSLSGLATITGVGFFDEIHGQTGVAPNGIELHPVLAFAVQAAPPPPPVTKSPVYVPAFSGKLVVKPRAMGLGASSMIRRIHWTTYGGRVATGVGQRLFYTCKPDCARGKIYWRKSKFGVYDIGVCRGVRAYRKMKLGRDRFVINRDLCPA